MTHTESTRIFKNALTNHKMHHAWLLSGPEGIGKAYWAKHHVAEVLECSVEHLEFQTHYINLNAEENPITIDRFREIKPFFEFKSMEEKPKFILIDSIDEMNEKTINALLKILEEPPENTIFLIVTHHEYRLLPTILSRVIRLRFQPLNESETRKILLDLVPDMDEAVYSQASGLFPGRPGMILKFFQQDWTKIIEKIDLALEKNDVPNFEKEDETRDVFNLLSMRLHKKYAESFSRGNQCVSLEQINFSFDKIIHESFLFNIDKKTTIHNILKYTLLN